MTPGTSGGGASPKVELVLTVEGREYRREFGSADQLLDKFGKTAASTNARVSLLTAGIQRLFGAAAGAAAAGYIVKTAREFETLNAQLLTVEKTEPRARLAFQRIQEFATSTPYQLQELVDAFIKLRNLGLDPSEEALTAYGNTASSMGKSLNQLIEAVADASTGEFERLKDFGITVRSEGDKVSLTFRGITTTVKKNSEEIQRYLIGLGNTFFAGGMQRQVETLDGVVSNFGDSVAALATRIDSQSGLTGALKEMLRWSTQAINELAGVSRPLRDIEADIASLQARLEKMPRSGRASAARVGAEGDLQELLDERLQAQLKSSNLGQLNAAEGDLQRRLAAARAELEAATARNSQGAPIMRQGRAVLQDGFDELKAVRALESQLKELQLRRDSVAEADKEVEAERKANEERAKAERLTEKEINAAKRAQDQIQRTLRDRELEVRLHGDASEAARVRAEIELGFYKDWTPAQRERLQQLAQEKDAITDLVRAAELEEKAREKSRAASEKLVEELGPGKTGRGFKRDLTNSRLGEVDDIEAEALGREERRFQEQMARLAIQRDDLLAMGKDYLQMEQEAWELHEDEKTRITREAEEQRRQLMNESLTIAQGIFGDLAGVAQAFGKDGFQAFKAFSIAEAMISTYRGALDAFMGAQKVYPPPMGQIVGGIAAAAITASGIAKVAQIRNMQYQGGREWGGHVSPGGYVRVGERKPELYEENGKFFLLPGEKGGKVSPAKPGPGEGRGGNINIHNYAGAEVQARTLSNGDVEVIIRQAAEQGAALAERRIAGGISNGLSPVAGAISSRYEIQQKPRR